MDLSIVVVSWNTRDLLRRCLAAVRETVRDLAYEVVVVDNGSTDGSAEMVDTEFPHVALIRNLDNRGFARANNQALAVCSGRYVLLLNSDAIVLPGALQAMVEFMELHAAVGAMGPRLLNEDRSLQRSWAAFPTVWSELLGKNVRTRRVHPTSNGSLAYDVDWLGGACLLLRRTAVEQVGLLDEDYFMYSEETDWCFRAREAGWAICYLPQAEVVHLRGRSSAHASTPMKVQLYRSKVQFFRKHYAPRQTRLLLVALRGAFLGKTVLTGLLCLLTTNRLQRAVYAHHDCKALWNSLRLRVE